MRSPRSVVSGGTGYVGRFIVEDLIAARHEVTIMSRKAPPESFFSQPVRFVPLSLEPGEIPAAPFEAADFFVHCAFDHMPGKYRGGEGSDPTTFRRRNLDGTVALFRAAKVAGVRRAVFLSSRAVYGPRAPGELLDEADAARPDTLYGEVKLAAERELEELGRQGFRNVSLRVTGVYGPGGRSRPHKWSALFADYLAGRSIEPRAASEVHGRDVAAAVQLVLESEEMSETLFNVSDLVVDRREILAVVKRENRAIHHLPPSADCDAVNAMRTDRLRALGWRPGGRALLEETVLDLLREERPSRAAEGQHTKAPSSSERDSGS